MRVRLIGMFCVLSFYILKNLLTALVNLSCIVLYLIGWGLIAAFTILVLLLGRLVIVY